MKTVNKNTYTFPDRKYKNRFKNYSINGKSLLILLCCIFSSQVCLGLTIHDQTKYYTGEFYQFNLSSCIRQQNSLTAQFVSFSLSNLANIFYPPNFYNN